jgi:two-component system, response regulator RegA
MAVVPGQDREVMLVDDQDAYASSVAQFLAGQGMNVHRVRTFADAGLALARIRPRFVLSELKLGSESLQAWIPRFVRRIAIERFVVVTSYPSIATAVYWVRRGVADYLTKPTSPAALLRAIEAATAINPCDAADASVQWPSLDRTIWEYLQQVYTLSGSMSEAARRLQVDRRSLRRMLNRMPPHR